MLFFNQHRGYGEVEAVDDRGGDSFWKDAVVGHHSVSIRRKLQRRLETFERTLRMPPPRARDLVGKVSAALRLTPSTRVLCHRDLHDKQILLHPDGHRLIDLDLASSGPPALDPANILAHVHLRWLKGAVLPWEEIAGRIAEAAHRDRGVRESLPVWTASTLLRLALIYSRRQHETGFLERLMDATEAALHARGCWRFLA